MKTAQWMALFAVIWVGVPGIPGVPGVPSTQAVEFAYTLKEPGYVSVAVYDGSGRQVRTLQYGAKQATGTYHLSWDGLDRYGAPQPAGQYQWRLLRTPGFTREFLVNLGTNITWREHDYWVGNHYGPSCLMVDDAGELYVGGVSSEGPPHLIKMSQDGRHLDWSWTLGDGLEGMAKVGKVFYWLKGGALQIRQASDGNEFWLDPKLRHYIDQTNAPRSQFFDLQRTKDGKQSPMTLAGGKDFLAVCYPDFSEVRLLVLKDDAIVRDETVPVPHPIHAAASPDGTLYVLTPTGIVTVDVATKQTHPLVADKELTKPGKMTFDQAFGDLLVTNGSQVRRYHAADGKLVATYGRPEGRVYGVFNPLQFDTLLSIAADGKGGFFTAELCPRRVAHFTGREQIELVKQWFGGMGWEWQALIDPEDPTIAFLPIDYKHIGRAKIDYATKSWTLTHLYETPDEFTWGANATDGHSGVFPAVAGFTCWWSVRHADGKTYLVDTLTNAMVVRVDADRIVPVACVGAMHPTLDRRNPPAWWIAALKNIGIDASSDEGRGTDNPTSFTVAGGYKHFAYSWADTNRNGRFDVDEVALGSVGTIVGPWGIQYFIDSHWNLYVPNPTGKSVWAVLPNESKEAGFPVWNWDKLQPGSGAVPETISTRAFWVDTEGNVYGVGGFIDYAGQDFPPLIWPNNGITTSRLFKWDREGRLLFAVGRHASGDQGPPGEFADLRAFDGCIRGNLVVRDACSPAMVWTPDGLYAGKISRDDMPKWWLGPGEVTRKDPSLGPWTDDAYGTQVVDTSMGVLWLANDTQNTMVIRVKGWDGWERQEGKLLLPAATPAARKQGDGLAAEYFTNDKLAGQPAFRRIDKSIWFGPMHGSYRPMNSVNPWARPDDPVKIAPGTGEVRWTGFIEAPVSEPFTFTLYTYGGADEHGPIGAKVRMWLDGKLVINSWDGFAPRLVNGWSYTRAAASSPVSLTAGKLVPIKIEYAAAGGADNQLHLYWESLTCDPRHVPPEALYRNGEGTGKQ